MHMRYRIRLTRVQVAERSVLAKGEEHAMEKVRTELDQPHGFFGRWQTTATEAEIIAVEPREGATPTVPGEGPLLMSIKTAAGHLGIPSGRLYRTGQQGGDRARQGGSAHVHQPCVADEVY
jgi:hypothetical protein